MTAQILVGHVLNKLAELPDESIHMAWTSPPYWGLRAYNTEPQVWDGDVECRHSWGEEIVDRTKMTPSKDGSTLTSGGRLAMEGNRFEKRSSFCTKCGAWRGEHGQEPTFVLWLQHEVEIFREVGRVLRDDGTLWINIGDAYATSPNGRSAADQKAEGDDDRTFRDKPFSTIGGEFEVQYGPRASGRRGRSGNLGNGGVNGKSIPDCRIVATGVFKPKDRLGLPHHLKDALQADGWWWRDEIVLHKLNPMPSSVLDRTTPAHEFLFMFTKKARYFYDGVSIQEQCAVSDWENRSRVYGGVNKYGANSKHGSRTTGRVAGSRYSFARNNVKYADVPGQKPQFRGDREHTTLPPLMRQRRSIWTQAMEPFSEVHFATAPTGWVRPCVLAGTSAKSVCPDCGTPWERVSRKSTVSMGCSGQLGTKIEGKGHPSTQVRDDHDVRNGPVGVGTTVGFCPTCSCYGVKPWPKLPIKPKKPEDETPATKAMYAEAMSLWERACEKVWDRRVKILKTCAGLKTIPAVVLDPFGGAGTTALVAEACNRDAILIEINPTYARMARKRIRNSFGRVESEIPEDRPSDLPLFAVYAEAG